jgi:hypothetical protein
MTTKLDLYRGAARALGERRIESLTENSPMRRELDDAWSNDAVKLCLSTGLWNFAMRAVKLDYSPSVEPEFGFRRAFDKPTDWVRTAGFGTGENFRGLPDGYNDEGGFWLSDSDEIYVRYISDDTSYGQDYSLWPANFTVYAQHWLALQVCERITQSEEKYQKIERVMLRLYSKAANTDAMDEPTRSLPSGSWVTARLSGSSWNRDLGSRTRLIG